MKPLFLTLSLVFLTFFYTQAQTSREVSGSILDTTKLSLPGSTVKVVTDLGDSTTTTADINGKFVFQSVKGTKINLYISSIGYQAIIKHYTLSNDNKPVVLDPILLKSETNMLKQVNIQGAANPVTFKEDTIQYNVSAYKVRENAPIEDVLKKLPGVEVDANGNVTAHGKSVTKVRVNGKDFFGGDVQTATKNLPADIVENIQVIDDYGDQANLTGVKTGEPDKILNITIRKDKNYGYSGQATGGDGADLLPKNQGSNQNRYVGALNAFTFNGDQQVAILGSLNNTNVNTFSFNSTTGGAGGGGGGGGFGGGGGGRGNASRGGRASNGLATTANGITNARSIGANFRDQWGKALSVYGSYSFSDNVTQTNSTNLQTNYSKIPSSSSQVSQEKDNPVNHRFNFNMEYKPDTINYLKVVPSFSYSGTTTNSTENDILSKNSVPTLAYTSNSFDNSTSPNYGLSALYNHRFNSSRRNISVNFNVNSSKTTAFDNPVNIYTTGAPTAPLNQQIYTNSRSTSFGTSFSYLEPIGKLSYLELNYALNHSYTTSDKQTDTLNTLNNYDRYDFLSNNYDYTFTTNRIGLNYRFIEKKYNYTLGLGVQPATLDGHSIKTNELTHVTTFNIIPTARFIYNFSRSKLLSFNYNGSSNQPSFNQLQPVTDFSNALYPVQGNPFLKPEFNNNVSLRFNNFSFTSGNMLFTNLSFTQTDNKIVNNTITYADHFSKAALLNDPGLKNLKNTNLTQYLNTNGYYSATAYGVYAKPWSERRYTLYFNASVSYTNNIGYSGSVDSNNVASAIERNIAKTLTLSPGLRFRVDIPDVIDAQAGTNYSINKTDNSLNGGAFDRNTDIRTLSFSVIGKNYVWKNWTVSYDYSKLLNYGYSSSLSVSNPNILNMYVERRFLKDNRATIRLSAFDLFNQNTGFSTTTTGSSVIQSNINRLGRYYLATFTFRLQKFAGKAPTQDPGSRGFRGSRGQDGGGPGGGGPQ